MFSTLNQPASGGGGRERGREKEGERERERVHASCQCRTNNRDEERRGRGYDGERQAQGGLSFERRPLRETYINVYSMPIDARSRKNGQH